VVHRIVPIGEHAGAAEPDTSSGLLIFRAPERRVEPETLRLPAKCQDRVPNLMSLPDQLVPEHVDSLSPGERRRPARDRLASGW